MGWLIFGLSAKIQKVLQERSSFVALEIKIKIFFPTCCYMYLQSPWIESKLERLDNKM